MSILLDRFEEGVEEIDQFFKLLIILEEDDLVLHRGSKKTHKSKRVDDNCFKIMKASAFLLLYNLVESSVRSSFELVYQSIKNDGLSMVHVNESFRDLWIRQGFSSLDGYSASPRNYQETAAKLIKGIFDGDVVDFDASKLPLSGNLDAEEIRKVCRKHGVPCFTHYASNGGSKMGLVRKQRNALAHGNVTFVEVGRQFTVNDLCGIKQQTVIFVRSILRNISNFNDQKNYLAKVVKNAV